MDSLPPVASRQLPNSMVAFPRVSRSSAAIPDVSIIIPARNEESNLDSCLKSLTSQTGVTFEIIVVDDNSTDRTREIAQSYRDVRVIPSEPLPAGWTGKNNAVITGAKKARAGWLLFTDADTIHLPGSLARALVEAKREKADLLSYSPEQIVHTFSERAVMPVIFAELAAQYPPHKVCDPKSAIVAANGQYMLVRRSAYDSIGGHLAVAIEILEDVALARLFRDIGRRVYFRYAADAVRTRMYRNWPQLREGWTKNLALLFPHPKRLALQSLFLWLIAWSSLGIASAAVNTHHFALIVFAGLWVLLYLKICIAHFSTVNNLLAIAFGLPIFTYLLLRSKRAHANGQVWWKNRVYDGAGSKENISTQEPAMNAIPTMNRPRLRTEN
jgi:glycosyltransferase involved in cell wall biosynthesis